MDSYAFGRGEPKFLATDEYKLVGPEYSFVKADVRMKDEGRIARNTEKGHRDRGPKKQVTHSARTTQASILVSSFHELETC